MKRLRKQNEQLMRNAESKQQRKYLLYTNKAKLYSKFALLETALQRQCCPEKVGLIGSPLNDTKKNAGHLCLR